MECPNCGAEVFEGDKFCGECGHDVSNITHSGSDTEEKPAQNIHNEQQSPTPEEPLSSNVNASYIFNEGWGMIKNAFIEPGKLIGSREYTSSAISGSVIAALLLVFSLLTFIALRSTTSDVTSFYGEPIVPISVFFYTLFYGILIFAIFFLITLLMNKLMIKSSAPWEKVLNDFSLASIISISSFIIGVLLNLVSLYEIGIFFFIIGGVLFGVTPLYIFLRYAENNNIKLDSYYAVTIYIVLCGFAYYIIGRIIVAQAVASFFDELHKPF